MIIYLVTLLIALITLIWIYILCDDKIEHMTSDEAIKNIASIYNTDNMVIKNMTATGNLAVSGNSTVTGNSAIKGNMTISGTTDSSTTKAGAVIVSGGIGVAKQLNIGGRATIANTTESANTISGALTVAGGVGIGKNLHVGNALFLPTVGGTPTGMKYYEVAPQTLTFAGPFTGTTAATFTRVDNMVFVKIGNVTGKSTAKTNTFITLSGVPTRFIPKEGHSCRITGMTDGVNIGVNATIAINGTIICNVERVTGSVVRTDGVFTGMCGLLNSTFFYPLA